MTTFTIQHFERLISKIGTAEKVTKARLGQISRELLTHLVVEEQNDIGLVNRLIERLTPVNKKVACLFFAEFLPFKEGNSTYFGERMKGEKKLTKINQAVSEFLANPANDIWSWAKDNVKTEKRVPDYLKNIKRDIEAALDEDKGGLSKAEVILAIMDSGLSLEDMVTIMQANAPEEAEAA